MGTFGYPIEIGPLSGDRWDKVEALVDTGATYTGIPRPVLDGLGITPTDRRTLRLANGQTIDRDAGLVSAGASRWTDRRHDLHLR